jgi:hypothetical protein
VASGTTPSDQPAPQHTTHDAYDVLTACAPTPLTPAASGLCGCAAAQLANIGIFGAELYLWLNLGEMIGRGSFYGYFVPGMYTAN